MTLERQTVFFHSTSLSLSITSLAFSPLPSTCRTLQRWGDALIDTFGRLVGGGDTEPAAHTYHSRVARMPLGQPTCMGGFGIPLSRDYATISYTASWLVRVQPLSLDLRTSNPRASLLTRAALTISYSRLGRGYRIALDYIPPSSLSFNLSYTHWRMHSAFRRMSALLPLPVPFHFHTVT